MKKVGLIQIKCLKPLLHHKENEIVTVKARGDVPTDIFWRRRLHDATSDNCCKIYTAEDAVEDKAEAEVKAKTEKKAAKAEEESKK